MKTTCAPPENRVGLKAAVLRAIDALGGVVEGDDCTRRIAEKIDRAAPHTSGLLAELTDRRLLDVDRAGRVRTRVALTPAARGWLRRHQETDAAPFGSSKRTAR